jgi:Pyruvate/2-oxoacid:ferredoxin oxidoreductase delta subunit
MGFSPEQKKLRQIGVIHYAAHWFYSYIEPKIILQLVDFLLSIQWLTKTQWGKRLMGWIAKAGRDLPHGIVITTQAAERVVDFLDKADGPGNGRFAIGPCLCQMAMHKWEEPVLKDIQFMYARDIFVGLKLGHQVKPVHEVKSMLRECHEKGYVHCLEMCMNSGKWMFCICNCEPRICVSDLSKCIGPDTCGKCIERCIFSACEKVDGKVAVVGDKCMGCGLCVSTCPVQSRRMRIRRDYAHNDKVPAGILTGTRTR